MHEYHEIEATSNVEAVETRQRGVPGAVAGLLAGRCLRTKPAVVVTEGVKGT